jgi:hypothetical protein
MRCVTRWRQDVQNAELLVKDAKRAAIAFWRLPPNKWRELGLIRLSPSSLAV